MHKAKTKHKVLNWLAFEKTGLFQRMMVNCILGLLSFTKNFTELLFVMFADSKELVPFDIVFLMRLRYISQDTRIAEIIKSQHKLLEDVPTEYIENILKWKTNLRVLLMLDGYDEYTPGTNKDIDGVIESGIGNCFLILTSRPGGYLSQRLRRTMDGEIMIEGFSGEKIKECSTKYLNSIHMSEEMLSQAKVSSIYEILHVPIVLVMTAVVFLNEENALPESRTDLYKTIFKLTMDRTTLKTFGCKSEDIANLDDLLCTLGEFSWKALQKDTRQLLLKRVNSDTFPTCKTICMLIK